LAKGLPIATGVIEDACRYLVKDRMDLTGARWSLAGAEAVLRLQALRSSHDFKEPHSNNLYSLTIPPLKLQETVVFEYGARKGLRPPDLLYP